MHNLFRFFDPPPGFFLFFKLFRLEIIFFTDLFLLFGKNDHHTTRVYIQNSQIGIPLNTIKRVFIFKSQFLVPNIVNKIWS